MTARYQMPENTGFGEYLAETNVADFDPHGFVADPDVGDSIVEAVLRRKSFVPAGAWEPLGAEGSWRLRYWDSEHAEEQGEENLGEIKKTLVPETDTQPT